jgi:hypothetical protein
MSYLCVPHMFTEQPQEAPELPPAVDIVVILVRGASDSALAPVERRLTARVRVPLTPLLHHAADDHRGYIGQSRGIKGRRR